MRLAGLALPTAALLLPIPGAVLAQGTGGLTISSALTVSESFTDNAEFRAGGKRSEYVTSVSPSVHVASRTARLQGSLDYSLNAQAYARDESRSGFNQTLAAAFTADVIQQTASIDVRAGISQQSISAFGVQAANPQLLDRNRTEVRTLGISPVLRGRLGESIAVEARSNWTKTAATAAAAPDSTVLAHSLRLSGRAGTFGWSADVADTRIDYGETGREAGNRRLNLGLSYSPNPDWQFSARAGRESDTVRSIDSNSTDTWGGGVSWVPSPRTSINAQYDRRYFGNGHSVQVSHRMVRGLLTFASSRDVNNGAVSDRTLEYVSTYENYFRLLASAFPTASPVEIDALVREVLRAQGIFIGRAVSVMRRQDLSYALQGVRATVVVTAFRSTTNRLDQATSATDDLSLADGLKQHGYTLTGNYTISPTSSLSLSYSSSSNAGNNVAFTGLQNSLKSLSATLSGRLATRVGYTLSMRHASFDSALTPYTENGGTLTLSFTF